MNHIEAFENGEVLPHQAQTRENQVGLGSLSCVYVHMCMVHVCVCLCMTEVGCEIREQQLKRTQSGSSSWSEHNQGAAAEANTIREQQLKWTQSGSSSWSEHNQGAAAEANTIREQQLK